MKAITQYLLTILVCLSVISCGGPDEKETPQPQVALKDKISRVWIAKTITEDGNVVYTRGATNNIKSYYTSFSLNLQSSGSVILKEIEGTEISGAWQLSAGDSKLIFQNLNPAPSESNGTLEFTVNAASETAMTITALKVNHKTGGTINKYELVPQ
jgi:hypothetical protein